MAQICPDDLDLLFSSCNSILISSWPLTGTALQLFLTYSSQLLIWVRICRVPTAHFRLLQTRSLLPVTSTSFCGHFGLGGKEIVQLVHGTCHIMPDWHCYSCTSFYCPCSHYHVAERHINTRVRRMLTFSDCANNVS